MKLIAIMISFASLSAQAQTAAPESPTPAAPAWTQRISLSGDLRLRTDYFDVEGSDERVRNRIRARFGFTGQVNDQVSAIVRLATGDQGPGNINSTNQTLGEASDKKPIWVDLGYVKWDACDAVSVQAGKVPNPFWTAGKNQLVWDADVTPEGVQAKYTDQSDARLLWGTLAGYWLEENFSAGGSENDALAAGLQVGAEFRGSAVNTSFAVSYYRLDVEGTPLFTTSSYSAAGTPSRTVSAFGNSNDGTEYLENYNVVDIGFEVAAGKLGVPVALYGDYAQNVDISDNNIGWLAGLRLGKLKDRGSWAFDYNYRNVEADAVFGLYTDSDFATGGTNVKGHALAAQYQIAGGIATSLSYMIAEAAVSPGPSTDVNRGFLDFVFTF